MNLPVFIPAAQLTSLVPASAPQAHVFNCAQGLPTCPPETGVSRDALRPRRVERDLVLVGQCRRPHL